MKNKNYINLEIIKNSNNKILLSIQLLIFYLSEKDIKDFVENTKIIEIINNHNLLP